jgi:hypothetical protein
MEMNQRKILIEAVSKLVLVAALIPFCSQSAERPYTCTSGTDLSGVIKVNGGSRGSALIGTIRYENGRIRSVIGTLANGKGTLSQGQLTSTYQLMTGVTPMAGGGKASGQMNGLGVLGVGAIGPSFGYVTPPKAPPPRPGDLVGANQGDLAATAGVVSFEAYVGPNGKIEQLDYHTGDKEGGFIKLDAQHPTSHDREYGRIQSSLKEWSRYVTCCRDPGNSACGDVTDESAIVESRSEKMKMKIDLQQIELPQEREPNQTGMPGANPYSSPAF